MAKFNKSVSLLEIKTNLSVEICNNIGVVVEDEQLGKIFVNGVSTLEQASETSISFFYGKEKHKNALLKTKARACIIDRSSLERFNLNLPQEIYFVVVKDVNMAFAEIMRLFYLEVQTLKENISKNACIDESAIIGKNCQIMHGSYIGKNVKIGDNVQIYPNVFIGDDVELGNNCIIFHAATIFHTITGNDVIIHSGARLGKDGFRYVTNELGQHIKVPHIGKVIIGNDVEIGANSTIDRGSISNTIIGDMCKLDNLVQIGHNVVLGKGCIVVSQVGIAGSVVVGDYVAIGGQAGIADNVSIASYSKIAAQSGVMKNTLEKEVVMGSPAQPIKDFFRQVVAIKKITKGEKI